jgi:sec-independent protein translocase protein TatB
MLNIGTAEFIVILVVAFLIVGPKDLPKIARAIGRAIRWARNWIRDMTAQLDLDEEIKTVKEAVDSVNEGKNEVVEVVKPISQPRDLLAPLDKEFKILQDEITSAVKKPDKKIKE